jgi:progressive ankylosis protein
MTRLRPRDIIVFWLPLAATWLMMSLEGPYIAAIVARMPEAAHSLAAYGVAVALAWLIESPIMMLLSAGTALVHGRESYLALRRFTFLLNAIVTLGMVILALPPVFRFVGETMIGLPPEIARLAHLATAVMIPWPAAIGYRRFYQGIMVKHHLTRRVAYGTVVRLVTMSATAAILWYAASLPGALLGAIAMLSGVVLEAAASRWMAHALVRTLMEQEEPATGSLLTMREITRFYYPLALTSMLSMALGPLVTFGLGRGRAPIESLAVWPVVQATAFVFRSGGVAFQEVGIALTGKSGEHADPVRRTAMLLGALSSLALALVAFTPLEAVWFQRVSGLSDRLASFALWPIRILVLLPALDYLLSVQRSSWIIAHRTGVVTVATAVEGLSLALALYLCVGPLSMVGAAGGAIAMIAGRLAANGFLFARRHS